MQKVSKQSLAMIALSILLAISIALTFTFAALHDSKTATGTITFTGGKSVELTKADGADSSITIGEDGNATITFTDTDFELNTDTTNSSQVNAEATSTALAKLAGIKIKFVNATNAVATIDFKAGESDSMTTGFKTIANKTITANNSKEMTLADAVEKLSVSNLQAGTEYKFVITIGYAA